MITVRDQYLDQLVQRLGAFVPHVYISPGSRSTALVQTISRRMANSVAIDERNAAFMALGHSMAIGKACAVVCTSGTAVLNMLGAIAEALYSAVPLVVISADRPANARNRGVAQTIDQLSSVRPFVHAQIDIDCDADNLDAGWTATEKALAFVDGRQQQQGPVHLNMQFEKPLERIEFISSRESSIPDANKLVASAKIQQLHVGFDELVHDAVARIKAAKRPLFIAGPMVQRNDLESIRKAVVRLDQLGMPSWLETASGLRHGARLAHALSASELTEVAAMTDLVVRIGRAPSAIGLQKPLQSIEQICIEPGLANNPYKRNVVEIPASAAKGLNAVADCILGDEAPYFWELTAVDADINFARSIESRALEVVFDSLESGDTILLGNGLTVRAADEFDPKETACRILSQRGCNGIDGSISIALGAARGSARTIAVLGDVTAAHDVGALCQHKGPANLTIVIINNGGGQIFGRLPIRDVETPKQFARLFLTEPGIDYAAVAAVQGWCFQQAKSVDQLSQSIVDARHRPAIIEFVCEPHSCESKEQ